MTTFAYDPASGGIIQETLTARSQTLTTTYEVDALGQPVKGTAPDGTVDYVVYDDINHSIRLYSSWNSTTNAPTLPTVVMRYDDQGYSEALTMIATPTFSSGRPTGTEAISGVQSLTRDLTNPAGQVVEHDEYTSLSGLSYSSAPTLGTVGINYLRTLTSYDSFGEINREVMPSGTITRTLRNSRGQVTSIWVGTDDTPTTGEWSPDNLTGTDMSLTGQDIYDNGGAGDGLLTSMIHYPGHGRDPIETDYVNHWQGRVVATKEGVQSTEDANVNRPLTYYTYDNLGDVLTALVYDGDGVTPSLSAPSSSLLRAKTDFAYDESGQVYSVSDYGVDQSTGAIATTPQTTQYGVRCPWSRGQNANAGRPG